MDPAEVIIPEELFSDCVCKVRGLVWISFGLVCGHGYLARVTKRSMQGIWEPIPGFIRGLEEGIVGVRGGTFQVSGNPGGAPGTWRVELLPRGLVHIISF